VSRECVIGQSASQGGGQSTLAAGTVFESPADTFLRIQSDIHYNSYMKRIRVEESHRTVIFSVS